MLRKKAAEELKKEQERKAAERRRIIEQRCGKPKNVEGDNEGIYYCFANTFPPPTFYHYSRSIQLLFDYNLLIFIMLSISRNQLGRSQTNFRLYSIYYHLMSHLFIIIEESTKHNKIFPVGFHFLATENLSQSLFNKARSKHRWKDYYSISN